MIFLCSIKVGSVGGVIMVCPDSLLRLWRYINHLLTYLLTVCLHVNKIAGNSVTRNPFVLRLDLRG